MKFLDQAKIFVRSGNGGRGCVSFRREANVPLGGPNGGDGGRGGSVYAECVSGLNTLIDFRYQQHFHAKNGTPGMGRDRSGTAAKDITVKVPQGTQILEEDHETLVADLTETGRRVLIVKGGDGGRGNTRFKSSTNRAPRRAEPGWPGEERWLWLRLKLIADAGLVGLPNAGKSTLLAAVSRARPKIADYPFTTLTPQLGVVFVDNEEFVLADIPGLIDGAHAGAGLGDRFLGHIERCGVLLHLVDGTADDVAANYRTVRAELAAYGFGLEDKAEVLALNKCDALQESELEERHAALEREAGHPAAILSGATGLGRDQVLHMLLEYIHGWRKGVADTERALEH